MYCIILYIVLFVILYYLVIPNNTSSSIISSVDEARRKRREDLEVCWVDEPDLAPDKGKRKKIYIYHFKLPTDSNEF